MSPVAMRRSHRWDVYDNGHQVFSFSKNNCFHVGMYLKRTLCSTIVIVIEQCLEQWELLNNSDIRFKNVTVRKVFEIFVLTFKNIKC